MFLLAIRQIIKYDPRADINRIIIIRKDLNGDCVKAEQLIHESAEMKAEITEKRKYLHSHAETGFALENTVDYVKSELSAMGYTPKICGKSGLVAVVGGKKPGKVFLLRADMDALPIREQSGLDFASGNDCMHACGHDMHTAMLLGAAKLLKKHEHELYGTVKLMFQPAEEILEGAVDMIHAGVLENPRVDAALMIHVMSGVPFDVGTVIVSNSGVSAPAADVFKIRVSGKGCHGSMPNMGIDPLTAAAHILIAFQEIVARELAMNDRAVLTIGALQAGGAANAIPDETIMSGSLRTFDEQVRVKLKQRVNDIAVGIAAAFRAEASVEFGSGCPVLQNDKTLSVDVRQYVKDLLGDSKAFTVSELNADEGTDRASKSVGSEDFAYISQRVPSIMLALAAGEPKNGYIYPPHHPMVKFDNDALDIGSAVYAYTAMRWLEDHVG